MTTNDRPTETARTVVVPDNLGRLGMSLAADILEEAADQMSAHLFHMQSLQQVADFLRSTAATVPEAANSDR
jgi:hypothetical protein